MVVKWRHCWVEMTSSCEIVSKLLQGLLEADLKKKKKKKKNSDEQEKETIIRVRVG